MSTYTELVKDGRAEDRVLVQVARRDDRAIVTLSGPRRLNQLTTEANCFPTATLARAAADLRAE